jgi:hypothetical protein
MGIDVLIPVLGRPEQAAPLAESLKRTQVDHRVLFLLSPTERDAISVWEAFGEVEVVDWPPGKADFAKKINFGFQMTENEWIFQGATDIRFSAGWDTQALAIAAKTRKRVIGTNDLHNPAVKRGKHSTHTLFARSYIEEYPGADGIVFSEAYDHQYVDNEFIELATRRREFISSRHSIVEHFHPHWGNAEPDQTFKKATRQSNSDRRLYFRRMGAENRRQQYGKRRRPVI